jgi:hypothetical protein
MPSHEYRVSYKLCLCVIEFVAIITSLTFNLWMVFVCQKKKLWNV